MSYWQYWKLNAAPFTCSGRNDYFRGQSVEEAIARIEFICGQRRSLATLLGPAGSGKSTLLNHLTYSPPRQSGMPLPRVCVASMVGLSAGELPIELARKLCGRRLSCTKEAWGTLADCFSTYARSAAQTLMLIDDVESCAADAENDLVRLVRAAHDANISIILSIETHLASTVSRWLMERSYLQIELALWDLEQAHEFLEFSLARCGRTSPIYTDAAIERLHELSRGTPRRLVQLADLSLIAGAVSQVVRIDEGIVGHIAQELPRAAAA